MNGKVYLVGSGTGGVDYLTVRAHRLLTQAEVLVYDALVDSQLLEVVPETCLKLNVGKRGGQPSLKQPQIDRLLVEQCQQGKQVVRLKSGDPFIFGRSSSEIQALNAAGCPFEVIPGISSALAAPLLAGIPLTDPVLSRCFAVLSAHDTESLDWQTIAQIETLVMLMGGQNLPIILQQLQKQGRSPQTPIAIIRWAGHPAQQIWVSTLAEILSHTDPHSLSPCVIVIGEVVGLRSFLLPTFQPPVVPPVFPVSTLPLSGKTVLVTRSVSQSSQFSRLLQSQGATVVEMPTLEIVPPSSWEELDQAIARLNDFDWLILTSTNAVDYFFERLGSQLQDVRGLSEIKIAVVGEKTAQRLKQRGLQPDFIPPDFVADSMVLNFPEPVTGKKFLFPRVESGGRDVLIKEFGDRAAQVTEVAAYQSACPTAIDPVALEALKNGEIQIVTFASSKTVRHFCQLLEGEFGQDWLTHLEGVGVVSIGPQTSKDCQMLLGRVDVEAQEFTLPGLTQAVLEWVRRSEV
ncbi:uroporphyrinogen-III C-methyltransferase [Phormidesmis sp. 146-35]